MTHEEFIKWLDEEIEGSYWAESQEISGKPQFWCGMKMAYLEVREKLKTLTQPAVTEKKVSHYGDDPNHFDGY